MRVRLGAYAIALGAIMFSLCASHASAQGPPTRGSGIEQPALPSAGATPVPPIVAPSVSAYPLELLGLLAPQRRGRGSLTPSIGVSEEYNDNVDVDNRNRQWDFITNFSPAVTLFINQPTYQLDAGLSFTASLYAREPSRNTALESLTFLASGLYRVSPELTLTASDSFLLSNYTNLVSAQGISTGRQRSWSNTFAPGAVWQMTRLNSLEIGGSYSTLRYEDQGPGNDSDTYQARGILSHSFTPRLSGNIGYEFTYLAETGGQEDSTTHTPRVGVGYQLTRTLIATIHGGPAITLIGGDTVVTAAGAASLAQTLPFGSASVQYVRGVSVAGGAGGTNDTQTASATLSVSGLLRGLFIVFNPSYTRSDPIGPTQPGQGEINAFTLGLSAAYQLAPFVNLVGGYSFFYQRTSRASSTPDADQNRVRLGLQFGYPINFD
jgi:hypothetical protein